MLAMIPRCILGYPSQKRPGSISVAVDTPTEGHMGGRGMLFHSVPKDPFACPSCFRFGKFTSASSSSGIDT